MGKGTIGINPFYHDGTIMSHGAMAGLLSVIISFTDAKSCKPFFFFFSLSSFSFSFFSLPPSWFRLPSSAFCLLASCSVQVEWACEEKYGEMVLGGSLNMGLTPS